MKQIRKVYVDFEDYNCDDNCYMTKGNESKTTSKSFLINYLIKCKRGGNILVKKSDQIVPNPDDVFLDVYKFTITFPDSQMIIKNVLETDIYYKVLDALVGIGTKIHLEEGEVYPDDLNEALYPNEPIERTIEYVDELPRKKYR